MPLHSHSKRDWAKRTKWGVPSDKEVSERAGQLMTTSFSLSWISAQMAVGCDWDIKGQVKTGTKDEVRRPREGARGLTGATTVARGTRESGRRLADNGAVHVMFSSPESR